MTEQTQRTVRERIITTVTRALAWSQQRWRDFREESPYFQAKVGLVVAYAALVVMTIWLAPPQPVPWVIKAQRIDTGLGQRTAFLIKNDDGGSQRRVHLEIDGDAVGPDGRRPGRWQSAPFDLEEGRELQLQPEDIFDASKKPPGARDAIEVTEARIVDNDGDVLFIGAAAGKR
jgi:hypothetical protein